MPSPSRGGGPAAMPKYQRIAAQLRDELDRAAPTPGGRLPSERALAARYGVIDAAALLEAGHSVHGVAQEVAVEDRHAPADGG
ncbi:GntR family transcriptional regulator, partial [Streptomyces sp. NPDC048352]|uniref:GntR family transcriptional regulator n=1 Tax=Streptomyces sp. NPDC048352 TaxID=3154718 RepID=UPI003418BAD7